MRYIGAVFNGWDQPSQLLLFDTASGQIDRELTIEKVDLTSLALNANTSLAAIGQEDGIIKLVDLAQMKVVAVLAGHKGAVTSLTFSQDGQLLYSVGSEGVVKIWGIP